MKIVKAGYEILDSLNGVEILKKIERCGRVCYKSEERITDESCVQFVRNVLAQGHESVIEHFSFTVRFICDRGVSHEIVRHRLASYSQESTRYCNYGHDEEITVVEPPFWGEKETSEICCRGRWENSCLEAQDAYLYLIRNGAKPQEARSVLPNSLKTEVVMTANLREWRHFFKLRCAKAAHPQMREIAIPLLEELKTLIPIIFDDITY